MKQCEALAGSCCERTRRVLLIPFRWNLNLELFDIRNGKHGEKPELRTLETQVRDMKTIFFRQFVLTHDDVEEREREKFNIRRNYIIREIYNEISGSVSKPRVCWITLHKAFLLFWLNHEWNCCFFVSRCEERLGTLTRNPARPDLDVVISH